MSKVLSFWKNWLSNYTYFDIILVVVPLLLLYIFDIFVDLPIILPLYVGYGILFVLNLSTVGVSRYDPIVSKETKRHTTLSIGSFLLIGLFFFFLIGQGNLQNYFQGTAIELIGAVTTFALLDYYLSMLRKDISSGITASEFQILRQEIQELKALLKNNIEKGNSEASNLPSSD